MAEDSFVPPTRPTALTNERGFNRNEAFLQQSPGGIAHETGELHRLLVESVDEYAIFALDPDGFILSWNEGAQRIKGYTAGEIIGQHFSIFYPPEVVAARHPQHELEIAARTGVYEEEGWRVRKDGSRFWANVVITALRKPDGTLAGFGKVTRDLTDRRAAEERAIEAARQIAAEEVARRIADTNRERTERLQQLTAALSAAHTIPEVGKVVFDSALPAIGADAGALGLIDESRETIRIVSHRGFRDLPDWARNTLVSDRLPMSEAVRTGQPVVLRTGAERDRLYPRLSDMLKPYRASAVWPLSSRGRAIAVLALHTNTDLDDETLQFIAAFAEQTAQALERATLYQAEQEARARADEANRAKSEFLAAMSHELRTPLNAIAGYAELLSMGVRGPITEEQRDDVERIKRSQQHLLGIINDILNFSRIEAGQITYDYSSVALAEVVDDVGHMVKTQASAKGLQLKIEECPPDLVAWADKSKVEQILLNLLSNSVKFTRSGSVTVGCDATDAERVRIAVSDTGVGIAEPHLEKIFEPFIQVGRSLTQAHDGTGLGLAISQDLARAMGGEITVSSRLGEGSTFTLTLPRSAEHQRGPNAPLPR